MRIALILFLQIGGFVTALFGLRSTDPHRIFLSGFAVHVVGDVFAVAGGLNVKISNYIKPAPWLQFVGLMLAIGASTVFLSLHWRTALFAGVAANALALGAFLYRLSMSPAPSALENDLQIGGIAASAVGSLLLFSHPFGAIFVFFGMAMAMAGFCYDLIYP